MVAARKIDIQHPDWQCIDIVDMHPMPGAFISPQFAEYEPFDGLKVVALNWAHAEYMAVKAICRHNNGEAWESHCEQCHHHVRFAAVCRDGDSSYHVVGMDCLEFIKAKCDREQFKRLEFLKTIKKLDTKQGERFVYSRPVTEFPRDLWAIPREQRPAWLSFRKVEVPSKRGRQPVWYASIWGNHPTDVLVHYTELTQPQLT